MLSYSSNLAILLSYYLATFWHMFSIKKNLARKILSERPVIWTFSKDWMRRKN